MGFESASECNNNNYYRKTRRRLFYSSSVYFIKRTCSFQTVPPLVLSWCLYDGEILLYRSRLQYIIGAGVSWRRTFPDGWIASSVIVARYIAARVMKNNSRDRVDRSRHLEHRTPQIDKVRRRPDRNYWYFWRQKTADGRAQYGSVQCIWSDEAMCALTNSLHCS